MIVSYPMYALPQMQTSLIGWWRHIASCLNDRNLEFSEPLTKIETDLYTHWLDPKLFFSQTCGYPLTTLLKNKVKLIGTPVYNCDYCQAADYCSLFIVRSGHCGSLIDDFAGKKFAFNGTDSQSGFNAVKTFLTQQSIGLPFFGENIVTGKHKCSIAKVANGDADICAVDCVTYTLLKRYQPESLNNTRVLTTTSLTPGLPFITSINTSDEIVQAIHDAIQHTCESNSMQHINSNLLIEGISRISLDTYIQKIKPATHTNDKL